MKKRLTELMMKLRQFMYGRYGFDELSKLLMTVYFILLIVSIFVPYVYIAVLIIAALILYRCFSKDIAKRSRERNKYLSIKSKADKWITLRKNIWKNRKTVKYVKCKNCKTYIRLPKGKGTLEVTCPKCQNKFRTKT